MTQSLPTSDRAFGVIAVQRKLLAPDALASHEASLRAHLDAGETVFLAEHLVAAGAITEAARADVERIRAKHGRSCGGCDKLTFMLPGDSPTKPCEWCGGTLKVPVSRTSGRVAVPVVDPPAAAVPSATAGAAPLSPTAVADPPAPSSTASTGDQSPAPLAPSPPLAGEPRPTVGDAPGPAPATPRRTSGRVAAPEIPTAKASTAVVSAVRTLLEKAKSEYLTFAALVAVFTIVAAVGLIFFLRATTGESAPQVGGVILTAVAVVFGTFSVVLARDRARGAVCLGAVLAVAIAVLFVAFKTKVPTASPKLYWALFGCAFFACFVALGLVRRPGESVYTSDIDDLADQFNTSVVAAAKYNTSLERNLPFPTTAGEVLRRAATGGRRHTAVSGGSEGFGVLMVFLAWADVVSSSWILTDPEVGDATTPAGLLLALAGGREGFDRQLAAMMPGRRATALRTLLHIKAIRRNEDGSLAITSVGEKALG